MFKEEQRFNQWLLWVGILSFGFLIIYGTIKQIFYNIPFGNKPMSNVGIVFFSSFYLLFIVLFRILKLETKINENGVYYRFFPVHNNFKLIKWEVIKSVNIIKYKPITQYGGWGIKHGSYTVKGNIGIQLELKNNTKLLIGTQKKEEATRVLETYSQKLIN